jgi:cytochrome c-type biogenesis protein
VTEERVQRVERPPIRVGVAVVAAAVTLALALAASVFAPQVPLRFVENLSSRSASLLQRAGTALPLGYAFVAGMVAAVNPCGFALLPAWLSAYVSDGVAAAGGHRVRHSLSVALSLTGGVILLFLVVGAGVAGVSGSFILAFPWIGLGLGILLTAAGGAAVAGRTISLSFLEDWAARLGRGARASSARSYTTFGVVYGLASLSCTLPAFLAVIVSSLLSAGFLAAVVQFVMFGAGMAAVLAGMTVVVGMLTRRPPRALRRFSRYAMRLSGLLLLVGGGYLVYYWLSIWPLLHPAS